MSPENTSKVFLIGSSARDAAIRGLFGHAGLGDLSGKSVALKANFNSADPFPASTHPDTLRAIVTLLKEAGAREITLAERSGMGDTRNNLERLGIFALSQQLGFKVVVLDDEPEERWTHIERGGTHWLRGFYLSRVFLEADVVIQTCCLKTHGYGGHFTMSLKNSVGLVAKKIPGGHYDCMHELHGSPFQRLMIAEINKSYPVDFVIMDAAAAFIDGGPDKGTEVEPGLMLAGKDRVALDAAGVAILREFGASSLMKKPVFELDQIRRAAELGVGAASASAIELVPLDEQSRDAARRIRGILVPE
ncbi:MAG: hypothetical protein A2133_06015 [Actinobacteria bacterium RBG_16_64_13]|nr:MAG: hypothetical protein A2133_06015 [Actinobacteria bacterium RBG_16_64_13]